MRIVGGKYGGRRIGVGKGFDSRPTTDFAREALFNILANHFTFEDIGILDLFSGTGSISFEFASRGCKAIDMVEYNQRSVHFIEKTAEMLGIKGMHVIRMDVFRFIPICKMQYDVIFADPPYDLDKLRELPGMILERNLLLPGGWLVVEHGKSHHFKDLPQFFDERNYGSVHFSFFKEKAN